jgi:hypothetical protein
LEVYQIASCGNTTKQLTWKRVQYLKSFDGTLIRGEVQNYLEFAFDIEAPQGVLLMDEVTR